MRFYALLIAVLLFACAATEGIKGLIMEEYGRCPEGGTTNLTIMKNAGTAAEVEIAKEFTFSGWEDDTCTLYGVDGSCSYTRQEAESKKFDEFSQMLGERCFD